MQSKKLLASDVELGQKYFNRDEAKTQLVQSSTLPRTKSDIASGTFIRKPRMSQSVSTSVGLSSSGKTNQEGLSEVPQLLMQSNNRTTPKLLYDAKSYQDSSVQSSANNAPDMLARRLDSTLTHVERGINSPISSASCTSSSSSTPLSGDIHLDSKATVSASSSCSAENAGALRYALLTGTDMELCDTRPNTPGDKINGQSAAAFDATLRKSTADLSNLSKVSVLTAATLVPKSPSKCKSMEDLRQIKPSVGNYKTSTEAGLPEPLNSFGLRPIRQKTRNAVVSLC